MEMWTVEIDAQQGHERGLPPTLRFVGNRLRPTLCKNQHKYDCQFLTTKEKTHESNT
jgi:hypothetical protein